MKQAVYGIALLLMSCGLKVDLVEPLPDGGQCDARIALEAWTGETSAPDGSVEVFGATRPPDGVTIRSLYVSSAAVPRTEFNYRAWNIRVPADRVAATVRDGVAYLSVTAYTSAGCASLDPPLRVRVPNASDAGSDGGG